MRHFTVGRLLAPLLLASLPLACAEADDAAPAAAAAPAVPAAASPAAASSAAGKIGIELNKVEAYEKGCRFFVVVNNATEQAYPALKLDMALFQPDGVIARQFALDLSPLKAQKKTVKQFDMEGVACDKVGSLFINDVRECKADQGPAPDCLKNLATSTLSNVQLLK